MLEHFTIENIEQELQQLYMALETTTDDIQKERLQGAIQERNLRLVRLCPNE